MMTSAKCCFVPNCPGSSSEGSTLFPVPKGEKRKQWFSAVGIDKNLFLKSDLFCCTAHFNVEEDTLNWAEYLHFKCMNVPLKLRLKSDVLPHIFPRQNSRESALDADINQMEVDQDVLSSSSKMSVPDANINQMGVNPDVSTSSLNISVPDFEVLSCDIIENEEVPNAGVVTLNPESLKPQRFEIKDIEDLVPTNCTCQCKIHRPKNPQLNMSTVRTIEILPSVHTAPRLNLSCKKRKVIEYEPVNSQTSMSSNSPISQDYASSTSDKQEFAKPHIHEQLAKYCMIIMEQHSRAYLGLTEEMKDLIPILTECTGLTKEEIYLTFRKIKLNESNEKLGHAFNLSESSVSRCFHKSVPLLAAYLQDFIFWPDEETIQANVPIAFRANYSKVQSIIDCFEVEIEKPSDPLIQAQTWSDYKGCNTLKYLISCTPDGFISFISEGFGGRSSDKLLVQHSGLLDRLKPNKTVMADRGFKHVDRMIKDKGCQLERPPSVSSKKRTMTKDEVRRTKVIASLRVHVERVIKRVRDFAFLKPHACLHHDLIGLADDCAIIACALINFQPPIFRPS